MQSLYAIFDLPENSPDGHLHAAYTLIKTRLEEASVEADVTCSRKIKRLIQTIDSAYKTLLDPDLKRVYQDKLDAAKTADISETHPRLGQLCVTSGIITMEQLGEAVEQQIKTGMALGEVLQDMQFITQAELDGLLIGQQMIDAPSGVSDPVAARLVALNLITEDMALIAQIEAKSTGRSFKEIMRRHDWVEESILNAVLQ